MKGVPTAIRQALFSFGKINAATQGLHFFYCAIWGARSVKGAAPHRPSTKFTATNDSQTVRSSRTQPWDAACNTNRYDGPSFAASLMPINDIYSKICHTPPPWDKTPFFADFGEAAATRYYHYHPPPPMPPTRTTYSS